MEQDSGEAPPDGLFANDIPYIDLLKPPSAGEDDEDDGEDRLGAEARALLRGLLKHCRGLAPQQVLASI